VNAALIPVLTALGGIVAGAFLKHYFDIRAGRQAKLLDEKLKYAVAFLSAADWAGRSYEEARAADTDLDRAITQGTDGELLDAERRQKQKAEQGDVALKEAHTAACALRLLMPELEDAPGNYIELSVWAGSPEDRQKREEARAALEARLVQAFRTAPRRFLTIGRSRSVAPPQL
jgi:hypothetical protein